VRLWCNASCGVCACARVCVCMCMCVCCVNVESCQKCCLIRPPPRPLFLVARYWVVRWTAFTKWLVGVAHTHGWRAEAKEVIREMIDFFIGDDKEELVPDLREMIVNINAWAPSKFKRHMNAIRKAADKLEAARASAYTAACERLRECDARIQAATDAMDATIRGTAASTELNKSVSLSRKLAHSHAMLETMPKMPLEKATVQPSIASHIRRYMSVAQNRETPVNMRSEFHEMLTCVALVEPTAAFWGAALLRCCVAALLRCCSACCVVLCLCVCVAAVAPV